MFQMFHSTIAYAVLALLLIATINAFMGISAKRNFTKKDRSLALVALIFSHIQLLVGLVLWFTSPVGKAALGQMSNGALRLTAMEHPLINIIALVLITMGWSKHKKQKAATENSRKLPIYTLLVLLLILSRIPLESLVSAS